MTTRNLTSFNESTFNSSTSDANGSTSNTVSDDISVGQVGFKIVIITIGIVGMFANGFVALLLKLATGSKKERVNLLMTNQMMLDMFSCASLSTVYAVKLVNVYLISTWGFWLCVLFVAETPLWIGLNGSTTNLVVIAVERYVMIVHSIWHKNNVQAWMIYTAIAFAWIYGIITNIPIYILTSNVVEGQCLWLAFWPSKTSAYIASAWYFLFSYVIPIVVFCFCYGRILATIVRHTRTVKPTTSGATSETSSHGIAHRTKVSIEKTMATITGVFVVCWMPNSLYYFAYLINESVSNTYAYQIGLFFAFLSICLNPFVYAGQYEIIRQQMKRICAMW